jgi:Mrp family chromosome partitioning ATPase
MLGGRGKLPVLAEIAGPASGSRVWSLRRDDLGQLEAVGERLGDYGAVLVSGDEAASAAVAIALAGTACAAGRTTALVDCDLAAPRLAAELGLAEAPGLHEYLRWEATPAQVVQPLALGGPAAGTAAEPLVCVCAGRAAGDPRTLLGLQSFRHMAEKLRHAYDLVIFLGPPSDDDRASLEAVAAEADTVLAALPVERASGRRARAVRAALSDLPAPPLGTVLVGEA